MMTQIVHFNLRVKSLLIMLRDNFMNIHWKLSLYLIWCSEVCEKGKALAVMKHRLADIMSGNNLNIWTIRAIQKRTKMSKLYLPRNTKVHILIILLAKKRLRSILILYWTSEKSTGLRLKSQTSLVLKKCSQQSYSIQASESEIHW